MSAFVVSKQHIDRMVEAGLGSGHYDYLSWYHNGETHKLRLENASDVGSMLWAENVESVGFRYSPPGREQIYGEGFESPDDFQLPGKYKSETVAPGVAAVEVPEWSDPYTFPLMRSGRRLTPVEVLKAISCYEYQSCEHPEWEESEAKAFCEALRDLMIGRLPGYDEAAWEVKS
jgi:hypothetical protein